jgi:hypothetical protein
VNLTEKSTVNGHLQSYIKERLPALIPGIFDGVPDLPDFTVDQRNRPLRDPGYSVN